MVHPRAIGCSISSICGFQIVLSRTFCIKKCTRTCQNISGLKQSDFFGGRGWLSTPLASQTRNWNNAYDCAPPPLPQQRKSWLPLSSAQWRIQTLRLGGHEAPKAPRSSAEGARIEAPRGVGCGEGVWWGLGRGHPLPRKFFHSFIKNGVFWSILMSKCASHVYTCIAYFHSLQYKPAAASYNYARVQTSY